MKFFWAMFKMKIQNVPQCFSKRKSQMFLTYFENENCELNTTYCG